MIGGLPILCVQPLSCIKCGVACVCVYVYSCVCEYVCMYACVHVRTRVRCRVSPSMASHFIFETTLELLV